MKKYSIYLLQIFWIVAGLSLASNLQAQDDLYGQLNLHARKQYTREQAKGITPEKVAFINWYCTESFYIDKSAPECARGDCPPIDANSIDIYALEKYRQQSAQEKILTGEPGYPIILLSWEEVEAYKNKMKNIR